MSWERCLDDRVRRRGCASCATPRVHLLWQTAIWTLYMPLDRTLPTQPPGPPTSLSSRPFREPGEHLQRQVSDVYNLVRPKQRSSRLCAEFAARMRHCGPLENTRARSHSQSRAKRSWMTPIVTERCVVYKWVRCHVAQLCERYAADWQHTVYCSLMQRAAGLHARPGPRPRDVRASCKRTPQAQTRLEISHDTGNPSLTLPIPRYSLMRRRSEAFGRSGASSPAAHELPPQVADTR